MAQAGGAGPSACGGLVVPAVHGIIESYYVPPLRLRFQRATVPLGNDVLRAMMEWTGSGREFVPFPRRFMFAMCVPNRQLPERIALGRPVMIVMVF